MVTFPEAVKLVDCAHERMCLVELLELSARTELSLCNMHSSKIWSLCTRFYVVVSAGSVVYVYINKGGGVYWEVLYSRKMMGNLLGKCPLFAFGKIYIWQIASKL